MMKEQDKIEIDVVQVLKVLWKRKLMIALVAIATGVLAFGFSSFIVKPQFTSTTRIYEIGRAHV